MALDLRILYRGPLSSCNYGCEYCPFAKREETRAELEHDRLALDRFLGWVRARPPEDRVSVFFTPWGEGLIRKWYQEALVELTNLPSVQKAAIQTNLSAPLGWVDRCTPGKLALWTTFHPDWSTRERFAQRVQWLHDRGITLSVGMVGFNRFQDEMLALRRELPAGVYMWINAVKSHHGGERYSPQDLAFYEGIDPLFRLNTVNHPSLGHPCQAGLSAISVDGDGAMRRCHFTPEVIGNLYDSNFKDALIERPCSKESCGCHIGYVNLEYLELDKVFGSGILERVPRTKLPVVSLSIARS